MNVRRSAAVLATVVTVMAAAPAVAAGPSPSPSAAIPAGLYGTSDPAYDGVWRQSLALLAQDAVGVEPADQAVTWLVGQQCADGAFAAFRADPAKACDAKVMVDTNSTAAAVQALANDGRGDSAVTKAVTWLKSIQNPDGGWGYSPGGASDANSTSVVIGALADAGVTVPNLQKDGKSPYDALRKLALPCDGGADAGAFAYQPDKKGRLAANADATAAAVLGLYGESLTGSRQDDADAPATCEKSGDDPFRVADNGAAWLAHAMARTGHLTTALPGAKPQPDYGNTADAIVALSSLGLHDQAAKPLRWLETHANSWATQGGPAAYAQLVFVATTAKGADVHDFGGQNLVTLLNATGPTPKSIDEPQTAGPSDNAATDDNDGSLNATWTIVGGILLLAAIIAAALITRGRKRGHQQ
ncbi:prenyltransferase/squalene oxidase repeat-containing protein [Streptomyces sp. NPDC048504]|uniref:prenyltransferase/squalene oxidase repeat-containing protein n=1 Tax=Streptomyces sp. NPDC048504 TaxID=3365559 RepID=UPI00371A9A3F